MFDTAIIMAAGKGMRMFPVSDYVPKPLIKIYNKPLIDHCIDTLKYNGIKNIYVTYGYKSELLTSHIEKRLSGLFNTIDQDNSYFLTNTIIKYISEPIIIIPCDIIMTFDFSKVNT
jgi:MurNAc alpha-1-phosphate uridylyltransferase